MSVPTVKIVLAISFPKEKFITKSTLPIFYTVVMNCSCKHCDTKFCGECGVKTSLKKHEYPITETELFKNLKKSKELSVIYDDEEENYLVSLKEYDSIHGIDKILSCFDFIYQTLTRDKLISIIMKITEDFSINKLKQSFAISIVPNL